MEEFSLADLFAPIRAHWLFITATAVIVAALVIAGTYYFVPTTWEAQTSIVFEDAGGRNLNMLRQMGLPGAVGGGSGRGEFLEVLLKSRSVRGRVVDEMDLVEYFDVSSQRAATGRLSETYEMQLPVSQVLVLRTMWEAPPRAQIDPETTDAPEMAAQLAEELILSLEQEVSRNDYTEAARRRALVEEQLQKATQELVEAENELVQYATSQGLVDLTGQTGAAVNQLERLRTREAELEAELDGALARETAARERLSTEERMAVSSLAESRDPAIDTLRQRILELQQQIAEQTEVQGKSDQHPDVASLQSELEAAEEQLAELAAAEMTVDRRSMAVNPSYSKLIDEALTNSQRVSEIRASIDAVREQKREALSLIEQLPARSTEYLRLQRQIEIKGEVVAELTDNYEMARLAEAGSTASFSVIDEPLPPNQPSGPSLKKAGALAFAAALFVAILIAFWRFGSTAPRATVEEGPADSDEPAA